MTFTITIAGQPRIVEVTQPHGAGGSSYFVFVDRFYQGAIHFQQGQWVPYLEGTVLSGDDVGVLIGIIEGG